MLTCLIFNILVPSTLDPESSLTSPKKSFFFYMMAVVFICRHSVIEAVYNRLNPQREEDVVSMNRVWLFKGLEPPGMMAAVHLAPGLTIKM